MSKARKTLSDTGTPTKCSQKVCCLACKRQLLTIDEIAVSASTQNQALNAILFFYREVLGQPIGNVNALRAKRPVHERHAPTIGETQLLLQGECLFLIATHLIFQPPAFGTNNLLPQKARSDQSNDRHGLTASLTVETIS